MEKGNRQNIITSSQISYLSNGFQSDLALLLRLDIYSHLHKPKNANIEVKLANLYTLAPVHVLKLEKVKIPLTLLKLTLLPVKVKFGSINIYLISTSGN